MTQEDHLQTLGLGRIKNLILGQEIEAIKAAHVPPMRMSTVPLERLKHRQGAEEFKKLVVEYARKMKIDLTLFFFALLD